MAISAAALRGLSPTRVVEKLQRINAAAARHKAVAKKKTEVTLNTGVALAAAFATGYARAYYGTGPRGEINIPYTQIDADALAGIGLVAAGIWTDSDTSLFAGIGILAVVIGSEGLRIGKERRALGK